MCITCTVKTKPQFSINFYDEENFKTLQGSELDISKTRFIVTTDLAVSYNQTWTFREK